MQTYCKGSPFRFLPFLRNLQNRKTPKGPPFQFFFGTVLIFFSKIFNFSKESPLRIFWYFATESMLMNPKGSPLFFLFQPTISPWMVHFSYNLCSFVQLIFWEAGDRGFDSRTKPQIFYASKSRCETKDFLSFDFFSFFRHYAKFSDSIKG